MILKAISIEPKPKHGSRLLIQFDSDKFFAIKFKKTDTSVTVMYKLKNLIEEIKNASDKEVREA